MTDTLLVSCKVGRNFWYSQYGDPDGKPVIYFHGFPGSRFEVKRSLYLLEKNA